MPLLCFRYGGKWWEMVGKWWENGGNFTKTYEAHFLGGGLWNTLESIGVEACITEHSYVYIDDVMLITVYL